MTGRVEIPWRILRKMQKSNNLIHSIQKSQLFEEKNLWKEKKKKGSKGENEKVGKIGMNPIRRGRIETQFSTLGEKYDNFHKFVFCTERHGGWRRKISQWGKCKQEAKNQSCGSVSIRSGSGSGDAFREITNPDQRKKFVFFPHQKTWFLLKSRIFYAIYELLVHVY